MRRFSKAWMLALTLLIGLPALSMAQNDEPNAPVRFGVFAGVNFNNAALGGNAANAIPGFTIPVSADLSDGQGYGPYAGLIAEYNPAPDQFLGLQTRFGYDNRRANITPNGGNGEVEASISYWAIEPALRFNLGGNDMHLTLGPGFHILAANDFDFRLPGVAEVEDVENGRLNDVAVSLWGGFGFDIPLGDFSENGTRWYLTPFVEGSWLINQLKTGVAAGNDNLDDTWSTVTVRGGLQFKYGMGGPKGEQPIADVPAPTGDVAVAIQTPVGGVMAQRPMIEYLPLLNYVFYEPSETPIPSRYATLSSSQARSFDENSLEAMDAPSAGDPSESTRSQRQLDVYYNVVNIIADRMEKNPGKNIQVVGSGPDVAAATSRAENVKQYLITTFGLPADRVSSRGQKEPVNKSGTPSTPKGDMTLVKEENIRVELIGDEDLMRPVKLKVFQDMPIENDMAISVKATEPVQRWTVRVTGDGGVDRTYGPFYGDRAYVNATPILGDRSNGTYTATVTATDRSGNTMTNTEKFSLTKTNLEPVTSTRYSVIFDYDDDASMERYSTFLRNTVAPNVPNGSIIYIHGHTDVIGLEDYNYQLSVDRAKEAEKVLSDELKKLGKSDVTFESYGFGETTYRAPFSNDKPETRHYNRTVMIEIIPDSN